jgi:hypothetical protein
MVVFEAVGFWCQAIHKKSYRDLTPFQPERLVKPGQLAANSERAHGI